MPSALMLWIDADGETEILINSRQVVTMPVRQTRHYNQFNLSQAIPYLKQGANTIEVRTKMEREKMRFDYGLQALYSK